MQRARTCSVERAVHEHLDPSVRHALYSMQGAGSVPLCVPDSSEETSMAFIEVKRPPFTPYVSSAHSRACERGTAPSLFRRVNRCCRRSDEITDVVFCTQIWQQQPGAAEETLRGIAGLEVPLRAAEYSVGCDLWDVFDSRRAGSLHVCVQMAGEVLLTTSECTFPCRLGMCGT